MRSKVLNKDVRLYLNSPQTTGNAISQPGSILTLWEEINDTSYTTSTKQFHKIQVKRHSTL